MTVVVLGVLALGFGVLSGVLVLTGDSVNANTASVELPDKVGEFEQHKDDETDLDITQTKKDYKQILGAGMDMRVYTRFGSSAKGDDDLSVTVSAVRAELGLWPSTVYDDLENKQVRDNAVCAIREDSGGDEEVQSCTLVADGFTLQAWTSESSSSDADSLTVEELLGMLEDARAAVA